MHSVFHVVFLLPFRMADSGSGDPSGQRVPTPGGSAIGLLMGRRPSAAISPGRLPSMRSRDLTLGGVKKVMHSVHYSSFYFTTNGSKCLHSSSHTE